MACSQTLNGLVRDCESNAGGLKLIAFANRDDVTTITLDASGNKVTGITMASSAKFKAFYFKKGQASYTQTPQFNEAGEYAGEQGVLAVNFGKQDSTKRAQMAALSVIECYGIAQDANGKYWLLGYDSPLMRTGGESTLGQAATDYNHYGLEMTSNDAQLAFEIEASAATAVIG